MPTYTTTYNLGKPVVGADEDAWGTTLNTSLDTIDDILDGTVPVTGIDINSGTLDGVTIGGTTAGAGTFTTLTATTSITGTLATAAQPNVTSLGTLTGLTVSGSTSLAGASTSADITFGDNDKAIFGAGSDLQIYHDGTHSYIDDASTGGWLFVRASELRLQDQGGTNTYLLANSGGAVSIRHANAEKFTTTATGIDVTGTVTADGLTVDGNAVVQSTEPRFILGETDVTDQNTRFRSTGGDLQIQTLDDAYVVATNRISLDHATGDISFYEDTGTTPKFFWDASAEGLNLGATSVPFGKLDVSDVGGSGSATIFDAGANGDNYFTAGTSGIQVFRNGSTERMRIDASGSVGIRAGTGVKIGSGLGYAGDTTSAGNGHIDFYDVSTGALVIDGFRAGYLANSGIHFRLDGSEKARIDVSGNLLVGKTTTAIGTVGFRVDGANGFATITRDGYEPLILNRKTSDGDIAKFQKDGTTVGSIGSRAGVVSTLILDPRTSSGTGVGITGANQNTIMPTDAGGNLEDAAIDLGDGFTRFKDLYLSGGVYLGGTGAANKLDDYEEGTWTPYLSGGASSATYTYQNGFYTVIGRQMFAKFYMYGNFVTSGTDVIIGGLPYVNNSSANSWTMAGTIGGDATANISAFPYMQTGTTLLKGAYFDGTGNYKIITGNNNAVEGYIIYTIN